MIYVTFVLGFICLIKGADLLVEGASSVAKKLGAQAGVFAVVALAVGNGAGRIAAGMISDKLGRKMTMFLFFLLQAVVVFLLSLATREQAGVLGASAVLVLMSAVVGANYGANLALFPAITKDYYGLKNFGVNYGLVFTAWGVGGFVLAQLAAKVYDRTDSFNFAFYCSIGLLVAAAALTVAVQAPRKKPAGVAADSSEQPDLAADAAA